MRDEYGREAEGLVQWITKCVAGNVLIIAAKAADSIAGSFAEQRNPADDPKDRLGIGKKFGGEYKAFRVWEATQAGRPKVVGVELEVSAVSRSGGKHFIGKISRGNTSGRLGTNIKLKK